MALVPPHLIRPGRNNDMGIESIPLARLPRSYQPTEPGPEQRNPPQSGSRIISSVEHFMIPQSYDPNKSSYVRPMLGVTTREAIEALMCVFGPWASDPIRESGDGIAPCGYEEL